MSYSYSIKEKSKTAAKAAVAAKVDELIVQQEVHSRDKGAILTNSYTVIDLLEDDDAKDVVVSFNGYVSVNKTGGFISAAIACSAGLIAR